MNELINVVNDLCGTYGTTTIKEIAEVMNMTYGKAHYWVHKYYKKGMLGIMYPGLGMGTNGQRYIYNKCCTLNKQNQ